MKPFHLLSAASFLAIILSFCIHGCGGGGLTSNTPPVSNGGIPDTSFGMAGYAVTDIRTNYGNAIIYAAALQQDGKILVAGDDTYSSGFALSRFNSDGSIDLSFGVRGIVTTTFGRAYYAHAYAIALQPDGKILAAGEATAAGNNYSDFTLVRYKADGSLDNSFGTGGIVTTSVDPYNDYAKSITLQTDGKIIVAGVAPYLGLHAIVRYNSDGSPDSSFGSGGIVTRGSGGGASSAALQSDGKIVVAGPSLSGAFIARYNNDGSIDTSFQGSGLTYTTLSTINALSLQGDGKIVAGSGGNDFIVARYTSSGTPDTTFGTGGIATTDLGNTIEGVKTILLQGDGKLVAVGSSGSNAGSSAFALVRYNTDGSLDGTFGAAGVTTTKIDTLSDWANAAAIQIDGKIIAAGSTRESSGANYFKFALARYKSNGSLDTSFDGDGIATTPVWNANSNDSARAMAIQGDGKIVAAGYSRYPTWLRYNSNGSLDTTFGQGGIALKQLSINIAAIAIQNDGKLISAGTAGSGSYYPCTGTDFGLVRLNPDGSLDSSFGNSGLIRTDLQSPCSNDGAMSLALQGDGKIVVAGYSGTSIAVARYNSDGSLDTSFGVNGVVISVTGSAYAVAIQQDGKIVVAGSPNSTLIRFNTDGSMDTTFGLNGWLETTGAFALAMTLQPDGKIVVAGATFPPTGASAFALLRYLPSGILDNSFSGGGKVITPIGTISDIAYAVTVQPDGKVVTAGGSAHASLGYNYGFAMVRYNSDGNIDTHFGQNGIVLPMTHNPVYALALQSDGKILAAGGDFDFSVARYLP